MARLHHESFGSSEGAAATADTDSTHTGPGAPRVNGQRATWQAIILFEHCASTSEP